MKDIKKYEENLMKFNEEIYKKIVKFADKEKINMYEVFITAEKSKYKFDLNFKKRNIEIIININNHNIK